MLLRAVSSHFNIVILLRQGKSVAELRSELREQEKEKRKQRLLLESQKASTIDDSTASTTQSQPSLKGKFPVDNISTRRDSSPVKPLNSILNLEKLLRTPHTSEQLSVLWRAYHSSRSGGTGRGFLSACVPVDKYEKMLGVATRYPSFVVPIPRLNAQANETEQGEDQPAYEFYFMEWGFHGAPPSISTDIFSKDSQISSNPQTSTILFTPLQEYKLRGSFATPYLALTHYTDLAKSHGVVMLRGEITPSTANVSTGATVTDDGRYLLCQQDAQLLAIAIQKFYLWNEGENERTALLQAFHDNPEGFKWEDLLKNVEYSL
ncbi:uncharacterized protein FIBRA_03329 [Fibroporia radiculosa]|uniref:ATP11-domain-containing protein n=1 Tax=Fibroporia radiculosa TaxID=599839 RepID=J4GNF1_9APHY|nr:uncharacterized protein FIBRA_03329 [Fibroporia radiculosa]CCM01280.1 predicted protein [Fibroporia radiculosa]